MKTIKTLLLISFLLIAFSCSNDDSQSSVEMGIYKVVFEQSADYQDYAVAISGGAMANVLTVNQGTNEEAQTISLIFDSPEATLYSKEDSVFFTSGFLTSALDNATENMQAKITIFFNNEIVYTDTITFTPGDSYINYTYTYDTRNNPRLSKKMIDASPS